MMLRDAPGKETDNQLLRLQGSSWVVACLDERQLAPAGKKQGRRAPSPLASSTAGSGASSAREFDQGSECKGTRTLILELLELPVRVSAVKFNSNPTGWKTHKTRHPREKQRCATSVAAFLGDRALQLADPLKAVVQGSPRVVVFGRRVICDASRNVSASSRASASELTKLFLDEQDVFGACVQLSCRVKEWRPGKLEPDCAASALGSGSRAPAGSRLSAASGRESAQCK